MPSIKNTHQVILLIVGAVVALLGIMLLFYPPALFPDPANGLQVLRSMHTGAGFNIFSGPDQDNIAENYEEFLTWWTPGQYLVPAFFKTIFGLSLGKGIAVTVALAQLTGLSGFYLFFKKAGFSPLIASLSILLIVFQLAFFVPYVFYNGGEILLFAFEGWFLYGCISLKRPGILLVVFVLVSGWIGFLCKSSFLWIYVAGMCCLWISLCDNRASIPERVKKGLWVGIPAAVSLAAIFIFFISKGRSPASASQGIKFTAEAIGFPLASPVLSGFSIDDLFHGLLFHLGKPLLAHQWSILVIMLSAIISIFLILTILRSVADRNYRVILLVFYLSAILFFGVAFLRQLNISYESRHFRLLGMLITPGIIYLISRISIPYRVVFAVLIGALGVYSFLYVIKGLQINSNAAKGVTGIAQIAIDQPSLSRVMELDNKNRNALFVFVSNDIGLEIQHNRIISLPPVGEDLKVDLDEYRYRGHAGPLFIILPESYNGPKEKLIMKSFPGYKGFNVSMLSDKYVLYSAK